MVLQRFFSNTELFKYNKNRGLNLKLVHFGSWRFFCALKFQLELTWGVNWWGISRVDQKLDFILHNNLIIRSSVVQYQPLSHFVSKKNSKVIFNLTHIRDLFCIRQVKFNSVDFLDELILWNISAFESSFPTLSPFWKFKNSRQSGGFVKTATFTSGLSISLY